MTAEDRLTGLPGDLVRQARRSADLFQRELAQRASVPQSTVGRIESGEATCARWATVVGLLHAAGCCLRLDTGRDVVGIDRDGERDRAKRRYPAHLDVRPVTRFGTWWGDWQLLSTLSEKAWYLSPRQRPEHTFDLARWRRDERRRGGYARAVTDHQHATSDPDLRHADPEVADLVAAESERQRDSVRLIASENYVSAAVLEATGTMLTNKYSEGYSGKRYYEGQQVIDQVETLAIERAKALFGVEHANVQPYSGSPANLAVYLAFLAPGETVMGMALPAGGHLTHGWSVSATGKWFRSVQYGVRKETGRVDMDQVRDLALRERPKLIWCGGTAIPRTIDFPAFAEIARESGAVLAADIAHIAGLVAGGAHPSPAGHADVITTTTHKTLRGPRGAMLMATTDEHATALNKAVFPGLQGGPHDHTTAAIAVALHEAAQPAFTDYAHAIVANAVALGEALIERGYDLVSGGTDNHLLLVDLTGRGVGGRPAAVALERAGLVGNYNAVPFDPRPPLDPSGIRLGTPAITTRGLTPDHMADVARWIDEGIRAKEGAASERVRREVLELAHAFPPPQ